MAHVRRVRALHPADHAVQLSGVAAAGHAGLILDGAVLRHLSGGAQRTGGFCKSQRSGDVFRHRDLLLLLLYPFEGAAAGGDLRL